MNFNFENPEVMYVGIFPELAHYPIPEEIKTDKWNKFEIRALHRDVKPAVKANEMTLADVMALQEYVCNHVVYHEVFGPNNDPDDATDINGFAGLTLAKTGDDYRDFVANHNKDTRFNNGFTTFTKEPLKEGVIDEMAIGQAYWFTQKYIDNRTGYSQNHHRILFMPII